jgi:two-component system cell cycle sensor histidine kinase/response regulator CckA
MKCKHATCHRTAGGILEHLNDTHCHAHLISCPSMVTEESFSKAFHANPAPMVVSYPATGEFIDVNEQWVNLVGYAREELIGRTSLDLGIFEDWSEREHLIHDLNTHGSVRGFQIRARTKTGEIREVLWSAEVITHQGERVMLSLLYDITERLRVEKTLRASEERFKRLLQNSNDIVSLLDGRGVRTFTAGPSERILGYEAHELIGVFAFDHIHPDDRAQAQAVFRGGLSHPGEVRRFEYRFRHKNGNWIVMETIGVNLLHDPVVQGIVLNSRDVTERNRMQDQLQQAMKMEAIGRLAGGVAHDFNNLLTIIGGNVELARREALEPVLDDYLTEVHRAVRSAASLTQQLLSFARRQVIAAKVINLGDLVNETKGMLARLLGEDIELRIAMAEGLGLVRLDPGQLEQVLVNLAINARDAMPKGGRLSIEGSNVDLDEAYTAIHPQSAAGKFVQLRVSDTGQGMNSQVKERIFEPFFTTKSKGQGTGLGLATTFGIIKQAGGSIEVDSEPDMGTTFKVYLPRVDDPSEIPVDTRDSQALQGNETVLLVEDNAGVRTMTFNALRLLGYKVLQACSGQAALSMMDQYDGTIDLLLTDVVMPGMNGRELAEQLVKRHSKTTVLFTSGYAEDVIVHHGIVDQDLNFLPKPFTMQSLGIKLREILDGAKRSSRP